MHTPAPASPDQPSQGPVFDALDGQAVIIHNIEGNLKRLRERLCPVLTPYDKAKPEAELLKAAMASPLANTVAMHNRQLGGCLDVVMGLLDDIELPG